MDVQLLICDEVLTALDPLRRDTLMHILHQLNVQGLTLLMISHDLDLLNSMCNRVVHLEI